VKTPGGEYDCQPKLINKKKQVPHFYARPGKTGGRHGTEIRKTWRTPQRKKPLLTSGIGKWATGGGGKKSGLAGDHRGGKGGCEKKHVQFLGLPVLMDRDLGGARVVSKSNCIDVKIRARTGGTSSQLTNR